jgi:hypothetical protein
MSAIRCLTNNAVKLHTMPMP